MASEERYLEAFKAYYMLKHDYENKLHRQKRKIFNSDNLSDREKRKEIAKLQPKCINCKRPGGTIFTQDGKNLKATCGNTSPCQLNIDITRGTYYNAFYLLQGAQYGSNERKTDIILSKLNLLFNYTNEEETAEQFEELLNEYKDAESTLQFIQSSINETVDNPEKKEKLDEKKLELFDFVTDVKTNIQTYKNEQSTYMLADAVKTTVENIMPLAGNIRQLTYSVNSVSYDSDDETYHLNQLPYVANDIKIDMDDPPIVSSFVVGTKKRAPKLKKLLTIAPDITRMQEETPEETPEE